MWRRLKFPPRKGIPGVERTMRYFIFYPPSNTVKLIDVSENEKAEVILELVKREFGLRGDESGPSNTIFVLNYNGSDIKPKWTFADLNIPSGAIIRCISKQQTAADLYIHCGFNKQLFKLFDSTITIETTIGTIRQKISDKLGLPLSTFCLESCDGKQRYYDEIKLMTYDIKMHDHIYLKVWQGFEKFINSCVKGFTEHYSHDDIIRHYQVQVALHIAAFYGHTDLARSVLERGARSDRPAGEHPSRQWSTETSVAVLPTMQKCPIHVAVERGHIKIVDLFVRQSILCTQVPEPTANYLPYQLAYAYLLQANTKEERQRFNEIYFYLKDKQFNLKIPLNANGEYVSSLLKATTRTSRYHIISAFFARVSLPIYCRIMNWYERARERTWRKYGGRFATTSNSKRVFPETGLLGYKVLIDGYNNKFEVPPEQLRGVRQNDLTHTDYPERYAGFTDEERQKIIRMKIYIKQYAVSERQRAKHAAEAHHLQTNQLKTFPSYSTDVTKRRIKVATIAAAAAASMMQAIDNTSYTSDLSGSQVISVASLSDFKPMVPIAEADNSAGLSTSVRFENTQGAREKLKHALSIRANAPEVSESHDDNKHKFPILVSTIARNLSTNKPHGETLSSKQTSKAMLSSFDAYLTASTHSGFEMEQNKSNKQHKSLVKTQQKSKKTTVAQATAIHNDSVTDERNQMLDLDSYVPLPDHSSSSSVGPIKSRYDSEVHEATIQPYQRYASASTRKTAIDCLQEAAFFKGKPWLKKVEISKGMMKHKVQQRIRRAADQTDKQPFLSSYCPTVTQPPIQSDSIKVN